MTEVIYLAPLCQEHERMWCEHDAPVDCDCVDGPHPWIKYVAALRQPTQSNIFDACDVQKHTLIVDQDYSSHTVKVKSLDDSQPIQSDAVQADIDAMESILWVDTIIDDKVAIAKAFARHRQYGYDQGYYDGQRDRQLMQDNALRDALRNIQIEAEREKGSWVHLKRVIALNCKTALEQSK